MADWLQILIMAVMVLLCGLASLLLLDVVVRGPGPFSKLVLKNDKRRRERQKEKLPT